MNHLLEGWRSRIEASTTAAMRGIPVRDVSTDDNNWSKGWVATGATVLAYRGFGSWGELKSAIEAGYWKATPTFTVKGEGDTQMALLMQDVVRSSGFHRLRGTGFLAIFEADIQGLPFATHMPVGNDPATMQRQPGTYKFYVNPDTKAGMMYPDTGLGIGIIGRIPLDRIKTVYEIEGGQVARSWPFREWESHVDSFKDNPAWSHRKKVVVSYPLASTKEMMHRLDRDQAKAVCGRSLGQVKREKALIDPDDCFLQPENIRNFWGREGATFSIRESQVCRECFNGLGATYSAVVADTSWRGIVNPGVERTEALGEAVIISTQVGRGRHFEVHVHDRLVAQRMSLAEAQAEAEKLVGKLTWRQERIEPEDALHYYFGWTEEFTEPLTAWVGKTAALPKTKIGPLYHGTTRAAAEQILLGGFIDNPERKNTVYLTRSADLAARYAEGAVKRSGGEPVVLSVAYIEGVSAHEVGYMDFNMAREAGADYSDMGTEIVVLNPWAIHGPVAYA